jgi:hypothetical protein
VTPTAGGERQGKAGQVGRQAAAFPRRLIEDLDHCQSVALMGPFFVTTRGQVVALEGHGTESFGFWRACVYSYHACRLIFIVHSYYTIECSLE